MKLVAITGGIGAGKSVVSQCLRALGYSVYDCDSRAKVLMDNDKSIIKAIGEQIDQRCVNLEAYSINRKLLSEIVFNDESALGRLNNIVHAAVTEDLERWSRKMDTRGQRIGFVETAILYQSNLDKVVDQVWDIKAPREIRVNRVMARNGMTAKEVCSRIRAQESYNPGRVHHDVITITNDGRTPVLPSIERMLRQIK